MSDPTVVACRACGRKNRVDPARAERPSCGACKAPLDAAPPVVHELDDASFRSFVVASPLPVLVDFYANWCAPCKHVSPLIAELARLRAGKLAVAKVDIDRAPGLAARFRVTAVPTLVIVRGPIEAARLEGAAPLAQLVEWVDGALAGRRSP